MNVKSLGICCLVLVLIIGIAGIAESKKSTISEMGKSPKLKHTENDTEFNFFPENTVMVFSEITIPTEKPISPVNGSIWMNSNGVTECYMGVWRFCSNGGII